MYPSANGVQKTTLFVTKLNELYENVGFDSEFALAFEIKPFKVAFFCCFHFIVKFSKYSRPEWVKQRHCFGLNMKKFSFSKVSPNFQMK